MLLIWHEAKHSIYPAPLSKGMKSYVQVGREWIIHKDHLWGLNYAHFKKSTVFGSTVLYMHEEQSCRLYKKPTESPYKCVDILPRVATLPRVALTSEASEMESWRRQNAKAFMTRAQRRWCRCAGRSHRWAQVTTLRTHHKQWSHSAGCSTPWLFSFHHPLSLSIPAALWDVPIGSRFQNQPGEHLLSPQESLISG